MKIFLVQLDIVWRDKERNFRKVRELLQKHDLAGSLVILPEMFATGFDVELEGLSEGSAGQLQETGAFLSGLAQEFCCTVQGSGITPTGNGRQWNIVAVYDTEGRCVSTYQKMHPFTYGGEHLRFEAGSKLISYVVNSLRVAPFICYDLRFPEVFRHATLAGAEVLIVAANWPAPRHAHWLPLLQARAIENQCYVIGVNRAGKDPRVAYMGESVVFSPKGERLALAGTDECVLEVEIDAVALREWRAKFPVLQDVRKEFLGL